MYKRQLLGNPKGTKSLSSWSEFTDFVNGMPIRTIQPFVSEDVYKRQAVMYSEFSDDVRMKEGNIVSCVYRVQGWPKPE